MELFLISQMVGPLSMLGFLMLADHPWWIALFAVLLAATTFISYAAHRRGKNAASGFAGTLALGFLLLVCLLLAGAVIGAAASCTYAPDPFCIFGAAPFLAGALTTCLFAWIASIASRYQKKRKASRLEPVSMDNKA